MHVSFVAWRRLGGGELHERCVYDVAHMSCSMCASAHESRYSWTAGGGGGGGTGRRSPSDKAQGRPGARAARGRPPGGR
eukprot:4540342-Prymnesium_polylepis.1